MNTLPIILSAITAFLATLSAGVFIKKFKSNIGVVCAFSAGFFIALSVFDLSPEVFALALESRISVDKILLMAIAGFVFLFALDRGFSRFYGKDHHMTERTLQLRIGLLSTIEFCSHAFPEGIAIGASFHSQF